MMVRRPACCSVLTISAAPGLSGSASPIKDGGARLLDRVALRLEVILTQSDFGILAGDLGLILFASGPNQRSGQWLGQFDLSGAL